MRTARGRNLHRIDYRHVIWSLVRKPGAFARYVYREEMFPSLVFRRAYDAIQTPQHGGKGDLEYLRILHLAASSMQTDVEIALAELLAAGAPITSDAVKAMVTTSRAPIECRRWRRPRSTWAPTTRCSARWGHDHDSDRRRRSRRSPCFFAR